MKKLRLFLLAAAIISLYGTTKAENEIGFIEKFALAPDRETVLNELIPGSEDYYFFHALQDQNTRQREKYAAIMQQWAKRFPDSERRAMIENREALLTYETDPQATLQFLRDRLNLQFNHEREVRDEKPNLPTELDPALIAREVFAREALQIDDSLSQCNEAALEAFVREKRPLRRSQIRALLGRLTRPDLPNLLDLIAADLQTTESQGFGEFEIQRALLPEQLDELAKRIPTLADNPTFVNTRLKKLAPSADADADFDLAERQAWLERAWTYAQTLSPAFNSLKANLLYQRLRLEQKRGVYDETRFLEYLKLPRRADYLNPKFIDAPEQARFAADLNADFSEALPIAPPIGSDEELVRDYFLHFFANLGTSAAEANPADLLKKWTPFVRENWLKPVLAEALITNGIGQPERWAALLSPTAFQALKDRVDVDFATTNPENFQPEDAVSLGLLIKNVPKLIVKVYEINTLSYFLTNPRQLNTDLPLDGLVANRETVRDFSNDPSGFNPFRRSAQTFDFPELQGKRGAWVIELIGGGKSSRALIRKGQWTLLQHAGPAGDVLTVLDEKHLPVPNAVAWLDGRRFAPDEKTGSILVPLTKKPGNQPIVLADAAGDFATLANFEHHEENYRLTAQFSLEREQLLAGREATVGIRANLLLGEAEIAPDLLQETKLTITSTTLDGVSTTSEFKLPQLDPAKLFTQKISVPERLATLTAKLSGKIDQLGSPGEKADLADEHTWQVNGINQTEATSDGHLSKMGGDYVFELLGLNGEPLADQRIAFDFLHRDFTRKVSLALRTDERGRVKLGALTGLEKVYAKFPNGRSDVWALEEFKQTRQTDLQVKSGETIRLPWPGKMETATVSLLETRAGTFVSDQSAKVKTTASTLEISGLPPGDYSLRLRDPEQEEITIRVTDGTPVQGWLLGRNRHLEQTNPEALRIEAAEVNDAGLTVQLANWNKFTRVHVAASRFVPDWNLFSSLANSARFEPAAATAPRMPSLFAAGREIGDEYRYILERRYARIFPGNMLTRPGLLLNPWEVRSTDLQGQNMEVRQEVGAMSASYGGVGAGGGRIARDSQSVMEGSTDENLDFLAASAPGSYNLTPDENGVVKLDRAALGDRQQVQIYAEDLTNAVWQTFSLPEQPTKFQDLRLIRNLDPQKAFTEKKEVTVLGAGQSLTLADILTSDLETYDSLASVHALFTTLSGDANLAKFAWILQWPALKEEEKRAKYSEFACHELNFFLSRKDPDFFAKVVQPYLRNKKDRTFMDDYLLGNDLQAYLEPWAFERLNAAERCLLAQRLPAEKASVERKLREQLELIPLNPERTDLLFATALHGRALQGDGEGGEFKNEKSKAAANAPIILSDFEVPAAESGPAPMATPNSRTMVSQHQSAEKPRAQTLLQNGRRSDDVGIISKDLDNLMSDKKEAVRQRAVVRQYFRALGPTKEWAENNYYQLPLAQQRSDLITVNAFWRDFAAWDGQPPFVSTNIAEASRNFPEMMLALAVLDLPFEAAKHTTKADAGKFTLTAGGPLIAYHREIKPASSAQGETELLVSQNFYRNGDRYREEGNEKFDKYVTGEFLSGVVYGANIVVTNPTSSAQKLELLLQIPQGALPVLGSKATDSKRLRLEPYTTQTFVYSFYFPQPGAQPFPHYPVNVARNEQKVGAAKPVSFNVVKQLSQIDKASWDYVSQSGSDDEVFAFLEQNNLERLDLDRIAWRARESLEFFHKIIGVLEHRHSYNDLLYSYAVVHNDPAILREWLRHQTDFLTQCGPALESKLLTINPIERRTYEHLEYLPLVNQRAHRLGAENRIANPVLREQYQALLNGLSYKASLTAMDQISVVYYLFLQDRVEEALSRLHGIAAETLPTRLQVDYFRCYAAFYEEKTDDARQIASQYATYPVDRWRKLFAEVGEQLDDIDGKNQSANTDEKGNREGQQAVLAGSEPSFDFKVEDRRIALTWKNLSSVTINYYLMDPEFLFSSSPFVTEDPERFSIVKPAKTDLRPLPADATASEIPLPDEFAKANVLVEVLGAGQRKTQAYHANTLKLSLAENYGRLDLEDQKEGRPVSKAYVKVYARLKNGTIRFFKDGYTDLRGKFDYASLNSSEIITPLPLDDSGGSAKSNYQMLQPQELGEVEKFSILIMSDAHGALVREASPPRE